MKNKNFTTLSRLTILAVVIVVILADIPAIISETEGDTISEQMYLLSKEYPLIPLFIGLVLGHFFWPLNDRSNESLENNE